MSEPIEGRAQELLQAKNFCHVSTLRSDGSVHAAPVWVDVQDGQPVLSITGRLTNITTHEILVPPLHVTLTDDEKRVLYNWSFSASVVSLKAGQSVGFVTRLSSPPSGARHLQVRLAEISK